MPDEVDPTDEALLKVWFGGELPTEPPKNYWRPLPPDRHGMVDMVPTMEAIAWGLARALRRDEEATGR